MVFLKGHIIRLRMGNTMNKKLVNEVNCDPIYTIESMSKIKYGFLRAPFARSIHDNIERHFYSGKTISHYTDIHGLYGIIESGGLWLSDHRFLNDPKEFEDGRELTIGILDRLSKEIKCSGFVQVLLKTILELKQYKEKPLFVCSFSKDEDSLDQWKTYGSNGQGISITFYNKRSSGLSHFCSPPVLFLGEVVYDDNEKEKLIYSKIQAFFKEYNVDFSDGKNLVDDDWVKEMSTYLAHDFINFKNKDYAPEKEIRIAVSHSHLNSFSGMNHRVVKGRIIPYITSKDIYDNVFKECIGTDKLPIKEVRVGPRSDQYITIKSIEQYLNNKGYTDVKVIKSDVPYRG